jgi:hypothetical protein
MLKYDADVRASFYKGTRKKNIWTPGSQRSQAKITKRHIYVLKLKEKPIFDSIPVQCFSLYVTKKNMQQSQQDPACTVSLLFLSYFNPTSLYFDSGVPGAFFHFSTTFRCSSTSILFSHFWPLWPPHTPSHPFFLTESQLCWGSTTSLTGSSLTGSSAFSGQVHLQAQGAAPLRISQSQWSHPANRWLV